MAPAPGALRAGGARAAERAWPIAMALILVAARASACPLQLSRLGDGLGTNIHWTHALPGVPQQLAAAFNVARMDMTWTVVETQCGQYNFSAYDELIDTLSSVGVVPYLIFDYTNPCYDSGKPPFTQDGFDGFANFAFAAVQHFAGRGCCWESWNEPNGAWFWWTGPNATAYSLMTLAAARLIRAAYPAEVLLGPTTSGFDFPFINTTFASGLLNGSLTAVSVHPYRPTPPDTVFGDYAQLGAMIDHYSSNSKIPIVSGEWGYSTEAGTGVDLATQAKYLARMWLSNVLSGVPITIFYDFVNDGFNASYNEDNFGTLFAQYYNASMPYLPKPAYSAALAIQAGVGNASGVARVQPAPGFTGNAADIFIAEFTGGGRPENQFYQFAAWTNATTCTNPTNRTDCGFYGITESECLARGCCFAEVEYPWNPPQCYFGTPPTRVSIALPRNVPADACFTQLDYLGGAWPPVCASTGLLSINVTDGPTYLL